MNIFTANQVNQVYAMKSNSTFVANLDASHTLTKSNNLGSLGMGKTPDGAHIYFKHYGAGGITRSDLIEVANIMSIKATPASKMAMSLKAAKVTLNSEALSSSSPIAGQDYVLRLKFQNPVGMSPDNQYWKYGAVHAVASMSASDFYKAMAISIAKNMSRENAILVKPYVTISSSDVEVTADMNTSSSALTGTATALVIKEVAQDWILGVKQLKALNFTVEPTIVNAGTTAAPNEVVWGDVIYSDGKKTTGGAAPAATTDTSNAPAAAGTIVNSKLMADYEYFYMGARADVYRMVNFPDFVPTKYLVDPEYQYGYDTIAIHFAYVGANHSSQKSEKDVTFIVPRASTDSTASSVGALAASILAAIEGALPGANAVTFSGTIVDGNVPEFDGTTGAVKDSGKAASAI